MISFFTFIGICATAYIFFIGCIIIWEGTHKNTSPKQENTEADFQQYCENWDRVHSAEWTGKKGGLLVDVKFEEV